MYACLFVIEYPECTACYFESLGFADHQQGKYVTPRDRCARCRPVIRCCCLVIACVSCIAYHVIMCISFAYMFVSCIRAFSPLSILQSGAPMSPGVPFYLFSCAVVKRFRIGPRLVMWPWFTTGRPPVKFRAIWTSFDTPTVNRGTEKASCVLQPNTPPKWPKAHLNLFHHLERSITIA